MTNNPIEQEPGRAQKVEKYKKFRRAQKTAEKALGELTIEEAWQGGAAKSLISTKDKLETAAGIIKRDLQGEGKEPPNPKPLV